MTYQRGAGRALEFGTVEFERFVEEQKVKLIPGARSIILVDVHQCGTSCGFSVPLYDFKGDREILNDFFRKKEEKFLAGNEQESMDRYWAFKSQKSVDGLPGMKRGVKVAREKGVEPLKKFVGEYAVGGRARGSGNGREEMVYLLVAVLLGIVIGGAGVLSMVSPEGVRAVQRMGVLG